MLAKLFSHLRAWWRPPATRLEHLHFLLYTRRECHLCDAALECLRQAQRRYHFALAEMDIDTDPDLVAQFGLEVPVVAVNGKVRFRGVVNGILLERLLEAETALRRQIVQKYSCR